MNPGLPPGPITLDQREFNAEFEVGARIERLETLETMQYQAMICGVATDHAWPGGYTDEHDLVARGQGAQHVFGLIQGEIKPLQPSLPCAPGGWRIGGSAA